MNTQRSFNEMSHAATVSPSPIQFGEQASNNFFNPRSRFSSATSNSHNHIHPSPSLLERQRTLQPHGISIRRPAEMSNRSQSSRSQFRDHPRLEHRASQTIIDLTDESEEARLPIPARNGGDRSRSQRPPQLGRSDALNFGDYIDLTDDTEDDLIITRARVLPPRSHRTSQPQANARPDSPSLFLPVAIPRQINRVFSAASDIQNAIFGAVAGLDRVAPVFENAEPPFRINRFIPPNADILNHLHLLQHEQHFQVPGRMDYGQPAFNNQKPVHEPPKPARTGFTRSPTEEDVIICPSCEQELVHDKEMDEPVAKRGGKAPTRKDREEHPFWVVKECGHVSGRIVNFLQIVLSFFRFIAIIAINIVAHPANMVWCLFLRQQNLLRTRGVEGF